VQDLQQEGVGVMPAECAQMSEQCSWVFGVAQEFRGGGLSDNVTPVATSERSAQWAWWFEAAPVERGGARLGRFWGMGLLP
jgi:hypothetical protein